MEKEQLTERLQVKITKTMNAELEECAEIEQRDFPDYVRYVLAKAIKETKSNKSKK